MRIVEAYRERRIAKQSAKLVGRETPQGIANLAKVKDLNWEIATISTRIGLLLVALLAIAWGASVTIFKKNEENIPGGLGVRPVPMQPRPIGPPNEEKSIFEEGEEAPFKPRPIGYDPDKTKPEKDYYDPSNSMHTTLMQFLMFYQPDESGNDYSKWFGLFKKIFTNPANDPLLQTDYLVRAFQMVQVLNNPLTPEAKELGKAIAEYYATFGLLATGELTHLLASGSMSGSWKEKFLAGDKDVTSHFWISLLDEKAVQADENSGKRNILKWHQSHELAFGDGAEKHLFLMPMDKEEKGKNLRWELTKSKLQWLALFDMTNASKMPSTGGALCSLITAAIDDDGERSGPKTRFKIKLGGVVPSVVGKLMEAKAGGKPLLKELEINAMLFVNQELVFSDHPNNPDYNQRYKKMVEAMMYALARLVMDVMLDDSEGDEFNAMKAELKKMVQAPYQYFNLPDEKK